MKSSPTQATANPGHVPSALSAIALLVVLLCSLPTNGGAQHYQVLHHFSDSDGRNPSSLVLSGTTLYGAAPWGGSFYSGVLFKLNTDGSGFTVLKEFASTNGTTPGNLILSGSTLYGTTYQGGARSAGTVFKINTDGSGFTILKHLGEASDRAGVTGLTLSGTTLYGTTSLGGPDEHGSVFKLETDGSGFGVLWEFPAWGDGVHPRSPGVGGTTLFGAAMGGGVAPYGGSVFRLNTDGSGFSVLRLFAGPDGHYPGLIRQSSSTVLHGVTIFGGNAWNGKAGSGFGTIFSLNTNGSSFVVLRQFDRTNGANPRELVLEGEVCYGVTSAGGRYDEGTLFQMQTDGTGFTVLESFTGGHGAKGGCLLISGNMMYGTTTEGGSADYGVVFSRPLGLLAPAVLRPPASQTIEKGGTVELRVEATGHPTFQWFFNRINLLASPGPTLRLTNVQPAQGGSYTVVLSNAVGVVTSAPAILTVVPLTIAVPPQSQTVEEGGSVEFRVQIIGPAETYQWFFNETNQLAGATNSVLRLDAAQLAEAGRYTVVIANGTGAVTSPSAHLTVIPSGTTPVAHATEGDLRAALAGAAPVTFACDGTINLSRPIDIVGDEILDGGGHEVILSGGNAMRVFQVHSNATLTLVNLTVAHGLSTNGGGLDVAGTVRATNCVFRNNRARGFDGQDDGTGDPGSDGRGGAICNAGVFEASGCTFLLNTAEGGMARDWTPSQIGTLPGRNGQPGGTGGTAGGGAICNLGVMTLWNSLLASNTVVGGAGGTGQAGFSDPMPYTGSEPGEGGPGGMGGAADGAALLNGGGASLINCTVAGNQATGGTGGGGGGGGFVIIFTPLPTEFYAGGGWGGGGGNGQGAIRDTSGLLHLTNCTLAFNSGTGGTGGAGGSGAGSASPGTNGLAVGGFLGLNSPMINTLLATNQPSNGAGGLADLGHNLSSDASCAFTNIGSLNNTDPKLFWLVPNGGPTLTMALLPGCPAIDAGDSTAAPPTDQRGVPRPYGQSPDIGAFEYWLLAQAAASPTGGVDIEAWGIPGQTCALLASPDLTSWTAIATNQIGVDWTTRFHDDEPGTSLRFYRLLLK